MNFQTDIVVEDFSSPRYIRKRGAPAVQRGILMAHSNVKDLSLADAKLQFIQSWQALPDFGISLFLVRFSQNPKKDEVLGVAINRLLRIDSSSGESWTGKSKVWSMTNSSAEILSTTRGKNSVEHWNGHREIYH